MVLDKNERKIWNKGKFRKVEKIIEQEAVTNPLLRNSQQAYWARKKQLLMEMYGIDWKSPAELNKTIIFN